VQGFTTPTVELYALDSFPKLPSRWLAKKPCSQRLNQAAKLTSRADFTSLLRPCIKPPLSNQEIKEVACAVSRRCSASEEPSHVEHPAAIRCKPSRPTLSLPQAPLSLTQSHTALDVAKQLQPPWSAASGQTTTMPQPLIALEEASALTRAWQTPSCLLYHGVANPGRSRCRQWTENVTSGRRLKKRCLQEGYDARSATIARLASGPGFHSETTCNRDVALNGTQNREE
jgi:hypothetical protein